jgi:hypothetical protein
MDHSFGWFARTAVAVVWLVLAACGAADLGGAAAAGGAARAEEAKQVQQQAQKQVEEIQAVMQQKLDDSAGESKQTPPVEDLAR